MRKIISTILVALTLISNTSYIQATSINLQEVYDMSDIIKNNYLHEVTDEELIEGALRGLFDNLDPYSQYYTKEEYEKFNQEMQGEIQQAGIGVIVSQQDSDIKIIEVIEDGPAKKAGIQAEDIIISIDEKSVEDEAFEVAVNRIRGEVNTKVNIGVKRGEQILSFNITRQPLKISSVEYKIIDENIGYIKIKDFNSQVFRETQKALGEFDSLYIDKIIFDVRNNPGGSLQEVINILRLVVPKGPILYVKDSKGREQIYNSFNEYVNYELAVLVNENSASASEILAGAIKERNVGKIIGTNTFGKGVVQSILSLSNGGAIKLTTAEYFAPNHTKVHDVGVAPHIVVENMYDDEGNDLGLERAVEELKKNK